MESDGISRSMFIVSKTGNILDSYDLGMRIGEGAYGRVSMASHMETGLGCAIKTMPKDSVRHMGRFRQEISILKSMDHPNIIKLFETCEDRMQLHLVMELCEGRELFHRIVDEGHFTEKDAAATARQMLSAVFYMHSNGFCHRDLKPENFMFMSDGPIDKSVLKLIDFGLAASFRQRGRSVPCGTHSEMMVEMAGSPYYVSPQVLQGRYTNACDIWSCGVILFVMLCGHTPFSGKHQKEVLCKIKLGVYSFDDPKWEHVSEDAKKLIACMLKFDPEDRFTAEQALHYSWIRDSAPRANKVSLQDGIVKNLHSFCQQNLLKKAALNIIAGRMSESHIPALRNTYMSLDADGDGCLSKQEVRDGMAEAEASDQSDMSIDLDAMVQGVDTDANGFISWTEFVAAALDKKHYMKQDLCRAAFSVFDQDGNQKISIEELQSILKDTQMDGRTSQEILRDVDQNGDGDIDFEEFMTMMRDGQELSPTTAGSSSVGLRSFSQESLLAACSIHRLL